MPNYGNYYIGVRLLLLKEYLQANAGKNRIVKRRELEEYLAEQGYPVEKKTLYADFAVLDSVFGLQLEYDQHKKGYRLLNPPFEPYELRLLVDGIQASKFITKEKAREITEKIKALAGKETRETLNRQAYVVDRVRSMNDSVVKDSDRIHQAIAEDRKIAFRFFHYQPDGNLTKNYSKEGKAYIVSPYELGWNNGKYYLYAYDGKMMRYFRVDRMENISFPLPDQREGKELYKKRPFAQKKAKVFDMFGGKEYDVRLQFSNRLADVVIDEFGKDTMMIPVDKDYFTITVPVEVSATFFAWVATFGQMAKILSPEPVVKKMKEFIAKAAEMYEEV